MCAAATATAANSAGPPLLPDQDLPARQATAANPRKPPAHVPAPRTAPARPLQHQPPQHTWPPERMHITSLHARASVPRLSHLPTPPLPPPIAQMPARSPSRPLRAPPPPPDATLLPKTSHTHDTHYGYGRLQSFNDTGTSINTRRSDTEIPTNCDGDPRRSARDRARHAHASGAPASDCEHVCAYCHCPHALRFRPPRTRARDRHLLTQGLALAIALLTPKGRVPAPRFGEDRMDKPAGHNLSHV